jgi:F0F1-type ATP synthase delta subunit
MADTLSRRKLAGYVADNSGSNASLAHALEMVAAYLIESGKTRDITLVVRAIEDELARRGQVIARVTTAQPLEANLVKQIEALVGAKKTIIEPTVDEAVIGGVRIETPGQKLDATIQTKLLALARAKQ